MKKTLIICLFALMTLGCVHQKTTPLSTVQVIDALGLLPMSDEACPGYFLPTFESDLKADIEKDRYAGSLIYYMMTPEVPIDPWHVISSDEILLYHAGAPMIMMLLYPDGSWKEITLGPELDKGHVLQQLIPKNTWMGFVKQQVPDYQWGLYGVMVIPAWHIDDIQMVGKGAELNGLMEKYPGAVPRGKELGLF